MAITGVDAFDLDQMLDSRESQLVDLLLRGNAHMSLADGVKGFPPAMINDKFPQGEYSAW